MQKDGILVPYITSKGQEVALIRHGILSVDEMFEAEHADLKTETWKYRGIGLFVLYSSAICLSRLLLIACKFYRVDFKMAVNLLFIYFSVHGLPVLQNIFSDEISNYSNILISLSVALFVIALAWIAYRPMIGVAMIMASISPFMYCTINLYETMHMQNGYYNR